VCVHGLAQARAAVAAAQAAGCGLMLVSAPGAAAFAGCGWWRALVELATQNSAVACDDLLDCGDGAGLAMAALRVGQRGLVLAAETPGFARVSATAERIGARVLAARPDCLDLAAPEAVRRLAAWMNG
jgi:hypothetical protein